jgi:lipoprotein NlpI
MIALRASLLTLGLALSGAPFQALAEETTTHEAPLVAYSLELGLPKKDDSLEKARQVRAARHEVEREPPPPGAECAKTLGASRFASQHRHLAYVLFEAGDFEAAIESYKAALECTPRVPAVHAGISSAYLALGRTEDARAALERGIAMDPDERSLLEARARLDFLDERWADALAQLRLSTLEDQRTEFGNYAECLFWLAQRRAGVREPEVLPHDPKEDDWPLPILETLLGQKTEAELVEAIREQRDGHQTQRESLTEALYYIGERYHANGDIETARKHFAAVVNLKQLDYVEYGMARAELARMREAENRETGEP